MSKEIETLLVEGVEASLAMVANIRQRLDDVELFLKDESATSSPIGSYTLDNAGNVLGRAVERIATLRRLRTSGRV